MNERFQDIGYRLDAFSDEKLVVCPRCSGRAVARAVVEDGVHAIFSPIRLTCTRCAHWATGMSERIHLWLETPCCGRVLWAYNERHLAYLEDFIGARLRERLHDPVHGWSNRSLASRMPTWMKAGRNRDEVLKALERLRSLLEVT